MKRILPVIIVMLAAALGANAEIKINHTTTATRNDSIPDTHTVTTINSDSIANVQVVSTRTITREKTESDFNFDFPFKKLYGGDVESKDKFSHWSVPFLENIGVGVIGISGSPNVVGFNTMRSWELFVPMLFGVSYRIAPMAPSFTLGFLGVNYKWLYARNSCQLMKSTDALTGKNNVAMGSFPDDSKNRCSRLSINCVTFPFTIRQSLGRGVRLGVSAILCWNEDMNVSSKYVSDGVRYRADWDGARKKSVTFEYMGTLTYKSVGVYVRYSPCNIFSDLEAGPKVTTISGGIIFGK